MQKWIIKDHTLEFDDTTHIYYCDGVIIPSVTKIVHFAYPSTYQDIDPSILKMAAELGTKMHKDIEDFENFKQVDNSPELDSYIKLKTFFKWNVKHSEIPIVVFNDNKPLCAGRIDQIITINDEWYVNDLKRTKNVHHNNLKLQLSLYALGYEQCYGGEINNGYCTHLRKDIGEFISIKLDKNKAIEKCLEYTKQIESEDEFEW